MKVAVVIPCHNGAEHLRSAVASVMRQSLPPSQVVIVDDASTDDSLAVAKSIGGPVTTVTGRYGTASGARLAGLAHVSAEAEALMFLDADDLLGRDVLASLAQVLEETPGGVAACPWFRYELKHGAWHVVPPSCRRRRRGEDALSAWLRGWYHPPCSVLWSRAAYEASGGWDAGAAVNNDGDLMMRALARGVPLGLTDKGEAFYRRHRVAGSVSGQRTSSRGARSRLMVGERLAALLSERGELETYRDDIDAYLRIVERDAPEGIKSEVRDSRARLGRVTPRPVMSEVPAGTVVPQESAGGFHPPAVSVVIPTFNRPRETVRSVESALAQTERDIEIIVVDDASTDETADVVAAVDDSRVRLLRQPENRGVAAARNRGMAEARGRTIAFLDSDDQWMPEKLERQLSALEGGPPQLGVIAARTWNAGAGAAGQHEYEEGIAGNIWIRMLTRNRLHGGGSSLLITREVYEAVGGFDSSLPAIEDWDYWIRAARFFDVAEVKEFVASYDEEPGRPRRSRALRNNLAARMMLFRRHEDALARHGLCATFLRETMRRIVEGSGAPAAFRIRMLAGAALAHSAILRAWLRERARGAGS